MTIKKLCSIPYIMNKLKSLTIELYKLEQFNPYKGNIITDMPRGGEGKDINQWYTEEKERIETEIERTKERLQQARIVRDEFIESIDEPGFPELRDIIRFKCVNNMSWREIEYATGVNRKTARKNFFNFFENDPKSPKSPLDV